MAGGQGKERLKVEKLTLRALRVNYDLSLEEVAESLAISVDTLSKYEEDSSNIPVKLARAVADYYGISLDSIFLGKNSVLKQRFKEAKRKEDK
ncbi:helix-turn-helix domain-containing protein [Streptococcus sp. H31]|uniref:helix-turn-helix domain-containing protein n=1 Tax=Streptococcus huangxiaojuni TaxID=3237239 RepID=UPI0034A1D6FD